MSVEGVIGSVKDADPSQTNDAVTQANGGALVTGIGIGTQEVYDDGKLGSLGGFPDDYVAAYNRIGGADHDVDVTHDPEDVQKSAGIKWTQAAAPIPNGGQDGVTGYYNHTGKDVETGQWFWAVEAA